MERILRFNLEEIFFMNESFRKILNDFVNEYNQQNIKNLMNLRSVYTKLSNIVIILLGILWL